MVLPEFSILEMTWNNRIFKHQNNYGDYYAVHECYYDENKNPKFWTDEPILLNGFETVDELISSLKQILVDVEKSRDNILNYEQDRELIGNLESPQN